MCHPDIVEDSLKERARELMQELNEAYSNKDIQKVEEILFSLQSGVSFVVASDTIDDKEVLKSKIEELRAKIEMLEDEIESIKADKVFVIIEENSNNLDNYFKELEERLNKEYNALREKYNSLKNEDKTQDELDEYWFEEF